MCFWYGTPFSAFWWLFPLMCVVCMVVMFLMMRAFFTGRFPCGPMHRMTPGAQVGTCGRESGARKGPDAKEGGHETDH
jgi:hypothetical protein